MREMTEEIISPTLAQRYLDGAAENRNIRINAVTAMARDISAGKFVFTGQPIIFDESNKLIDGQHRLSAIVLAGKAVKIAVVRGIPKEYQKNIDCGAKRTVADALGFKGFKNKHVVAAIARAMMSGVRARKNPTHDESLEFVETHKDALEFVMKHIYLHRKYITPGSVLAVAGRAWYTQDHELLKEFFKALTTGIVYEGLENAGVLRDLLLRPLGGKQIRPSSLYSRCSWVLWQTIQGKRIKFVREATTEYFPLPEELAFDSEQ